MKVGDLVEHIITGRLGLVKKVFQAPGPSPDNNLIGVVWTDGWKGLCRSPKLKILNADK
jgi:hypothetical protein